MTVRQACICSLSTLALLVSASASWSAPLSTSAGELKGDRVANTGIEKAAYRRCWWRHGERVCRWVGYGPYDYYDDGYYGYGPDYGFGPSIGFSFGGGGGRHFHGRHHR